MWVCAYVSVCACVKVRAYVSECVCVHERVILYLCASGAICVCLWACEHVCVCVCVHNIHTHMLTYIHDVQRDRQTDADRQTYLTSQSDGRLSKMPIFGQTFTTHMQTRGVCSHNTCPIHVHAIDTASLIIGVLQIRNSRGMWAQRRRVGTWKWRERHWGSRPVCVA